MTTSPSAAPPAATSTESVNEPTLLTETGPEPVVDAPKPSGAPDAYAEFKFPEGRAANQALIDEASPIFKELGLSQDAAQKLVDLATKANDAALENLHKQMRDTRAGWKAESKAWLDANGGSDANKAEIGKALNLVFDGDAKGLADFRRFMDMTVAGDNPAFIRAFATMSKAYTEGKTVQGAGPSEHGQREPGTDTRPSLASAIYPGGPRTGPYRPPNQNPPQGG